MNSTRSIRFVIGIGCLLLLALTMGWFVGHYIPGQPQEPESRVPLPRLSGSELAARQIVDGNGADPLLLEGIVQGQAFTWDVRQPIVSIGETNEVLSDEAAIESMKQIGQWKYECPSIELRVMEVKKVSGEGFAEWYPDYRTMDKVLRDRSMVLVTASITNMSDTDIDYWQGIPEFTLWSNLIDCPDSDLGAGIPIDREAFVYLDSERQSNLRRDQPEKNLDDAPLRFSIKPGGSYEITFPFLVHKNQLKDPTLFEDISFSDLSMQIADYESETIYRIQLQ